MSGRWTSRGFTLIELLITIAIIAIMVGIGVPAYSSFTQGSAVSGATSELVAALNDARAMAAAEHRTIRVIAPTGNWASGFQTVRLNSLSTSADDEVVYTVIHNMGGKVAIRETTATLTQIDYNSAGRTATASFVISINGGTVGTPAREVNLNPFGRVQLRVATVKTPGTPPGLEYVP